MADLVGPEETSLQIKRPQGLIIPVKVLCVFSINHEKSVSRVNKEPRGVVSFLQHDLSAEPPIR